MDKPPQTSKRTQEAAARRLADRHKRLLLARFASSLSHRFGSHLQVISGRAALVQRAVEAGKAAEAARHAEILDAKSRQLAAELSQVVEGLRQRQGAAEAVTLSELFEACHELSSEDGGGAHVGPITVAESEPQQVLLYRDDFVCFACELSRLLVRQSSPADTSTSGLPGSARVLAASTGRGSGPCLELRLECCGLKSATRDEIAGTSAEPWFDGELDADRLAWSGLRELLRTHRGNLRVEGEVVVVTWPLEVG